MSRAAARPGAAAREGSERRRANDASAVVIVLNWNGWRDTLACLAALENDPDGVRHVVVVDNGSTDGSRERIAAWAAEQAAGHGPCAAAAEGGAADPSGRIAFASARCTLLALPHNAGFAGGVNAAIDHVLATLPAAPYVFLLNNDAIPARSCIAACVAVAEQQDAAVVGAVIKDPAGERVLFAGGEFPRELFRRAPAPRAVLGEHWPVDRTNGCAMLVRTDLLRRRRAEDGFCLDPALFLYGEEIDLCVRAKRWGFNVLMAGGAVALHAVSKSAGPLLPHYYLTRNRIYLARRLLPPWQRRLFHLWFAPSRVVMMLRWRLHGRRDVCRAIRDGLRDGYRGRQGPWIR